MHATVGDEIVVDSRAQDATRRRGEVTEVIGEGDTRHYRVRWHDGHESLYFPGSDAHVAPPQ